MSRISLMPSRPLLINIFTIIFIFTPEYREMSAASSCLRTFLIAKTSALFIDYGYASSGRRPMYARFESLSILYYR